MTTHRVLNRSRLLDHGPVQLRTDAVDIIEHAIQAADPYEATKRFVQLEGHTLKIGSLEYDLDKWQNILVLGAGKATQGIALALEEILTDRIHEGVVVLKRGESHQLRRIRVITAAHPVPDECSLQGGRALIELAHKAGEHDLVLCAVTGGSSALAILPPEGITLLDKQRLNDLLLKSGATIREINAVRKHTSQIKGGRLAEEIFPAELVSLTVSDVVGDPLDYITDLTVPDTSSYLDAWATLEKYHLWDKLPQPIREHLLRGGDVESPKQLHGRYHTFVIVPGDAAFLGAVVRSRELGYDTHLIPAEIEGECQAEARAFTARAESLFAEASRERPCALIGRGETTAAIGAAHGRGGPNQEFGLSAALSIENQPGMVVVSIDLDGTDGPTEACGALVDGNSVHRANLSGLDTLATLHNHASMEVHEKTGDLVFTGPTGTNVNDLMFVLMDRRNNTE